MRHKLDKKKLNRQPDHRRQLLRNLITSFLESGRITTTQAKAVFLRPQLERFLSRLGYSSALSARRYLEAVLTGNNTASAKFMSDVWPKLKTQKSGFIKIIKLGPRRGDGAEMVRVEWAVALSKSLAKKVKAPKKPGKNNKDRAKKEKKDGVNEE